MSNLDTTHILTRGVEQVLPGSDTLAELMNKKKIRVYLGIDPTGSLLTLGHGVVLRKLQQLADAGHEVILLIGNGTVRIGDPTGRDSTRPELTDAVIEENFRHWRAQASRILNFDKITIKHNGDWLDKLSYADMVKLMAQTTVQQLVERDMFQERIKNELPIFGHEILYPLLQGYDSVVMDVDLEIGGSDQLFNMMMGRHLQRVYNNREKWVLTTPIINGTDGRKMSKSYDNFIALNEPAQDMYGKLMSMADSEILTYFAVLTDVPDEQIENIRTAIEGGDNPMEYKKELALTITSDLHSPEAAQAASEHFERTVQRREVPEEIPQVQVDSKPWLIGELLTECLPDESKNNLRRLLDQGAVSMLEPEKIIFDQGWEQPVVVAQEGSVLKIGKRKFFRVINKD
ncbi:MAG: tyrosine--tRNA ligase [Patescibacteria group bacterium]